MTQQTSRLTNESSTHIGAAERLKLLDSEESEQVGDIADAVDRSSVGRISPRPSSSAAPLSDRATPPSPRGEGSAVSPVFQKHRKPASALTPPIQSPVTVLSPRCCTGNSGFPSPFFTPQPQRLPAPPPLMLPRVLASDNVSEIVLTEDSPPEEGAETSRLSHHRRLSKSARELGSGEENRPYVDSPRFPGTPRLMRSDSSTSLRNGEINSPRADKIVRDDHEEPEEDTHVVTTNPVFNKPRFFLDATVLKEISYLSKVSGLYFNETKARNKLSRCILRYPEKKQTIIDFLIQIRTPLTNPRYIGRFNKVMAWVLITPKCEDFICLYLNDMEIKADEFATMAVEHLRKQKDFSSTMLQTIIRFTTCELVDQQRDTLFREDFLSSCLGREFAYIVWGKELTRISSTISEALKCSELSGLCLNYEIVKDKTIETNPTFEILDPDLKEKIIQEVLAANAGRFIEFGEIVLKGVFMMEVPQTISKMLTARRMLIMDFLKCHPIEENEDPIRVSRLYIAEILTLRILNPQIISISTDPEVRSVLVSLTKVLQRCAVEVPFDGSRGGEIYEKLNPLYDKLIEKYRFFIDLHSSPAHRSTFGLMKIGKRVHSNQ